jgi:hypothetical protein
MAGPNWAEQVTAIATAVGALGLLGAIGAALFAGQQVREERKTRQAHMAADFFRRWDEDALVETRRLVDEFESKWDLRDAFRQFRAVNAPETYIIYRELDFFEQLAAFELQGAIDLQLIEMMLGQILIDRWEMWQPTLDEMERDHPYPNFEALVGKLRGTVGGEPGTTSASLAR